MKSTRRLGCVNWRLECGSCRHTLMEVPSSPLPPPAREGRIEIIVKNGFLIEIRYCTGRRQHPAVETVEQSSGGSDGCIGESGDRGQGQATEGGGRGGEGVTNNKWRQ